MNSRRKVGNMTLTTFHENSFIKNSKTILIMAQVICMIPVSGILSNDLHQIKFSYMSLKVILFLIVDASVACMVFTYSVVFVQYTCKLEAAEYFVFYFTSFVLYLVFFQLAIKWKTIMRNWYEMDKIFQKYCGEVKLSLLQRTFMLCITILTIIEYILYIYSNVTKSKIFTGGEFSIDFYLGVLNSEIYTCCESYYNKYLFVCGQISSFFATFSILIANLFIVAAALLINRYITGFYNFLENRGILFSHHKAEINPLLHRKSEDEWRKIRVDYNRISNLCASFDGDVSLITCVCVVYQVFFVLFYFLHILKNMDSPLNVHNSYYSLACLFVEMLLLLFSTAGVHETSCKISSLLYKISPKHYSQEIEHLMWKVTLEKISFTLRGYYKINRNTILNILGTIITYELFALQLKNEYTDKEIKTV